MVGAVVVSTFRGLEELRLGSESLGDEHVRIHLMFSSSPGFQGHRS